MTYIFYRAEGFYPITCASDAEAIENAHLNPGTTRVTDEAGRVVFTPEPAPPSHRTHQETGHD